MKLVEKRKTRQGNFHHLLIDYSLSCPTRTNFHFHSFDSILFSFLNYRSLPFLILLFSEKCPLFEPLKDPSLCQTTLTLRLCFATSKEILRRLVTKVGKLSTFSRNSNRKPLISSSPSTTSPSQRTCLFNSSLLPL